jgi:hypothetical protein
MMGMIMKHLWTHFLAYPVVERVAREKRSYHQSSFANNDEEQQGIRPQPIVVDDRVQMDIDVQDKID